MLKNVIFTAVCYCWCIVLCRSQVTIDGCDVTKHCFRDPAECQLSDASCRFISWRQSTNGSYDFEMSGGTGNGGQYIAFALGLVNEMRTADLYFCDGTTVRSGVIQTFRRPPSYLNMEGGLQSKHAASVNGVGQCILNRPASIVKNISDTEIKDFDITKENFYLLVAQGSMNAADNGEVTRHDWRNVSNDRYNFSSGISQEPVTDEGCDVTKSCFKDPVNCVVGNSDCRFYSWKKEVDGSYEFEMSGGTGDGQQYIAMALGTMSAMQDADLYYCDGTAVRSGVIQALHKPPAYLEMTGGLATKRASTTNGCAQCVFSRPASVTKTISNGVSKNFNLTMDEFYLLGAVGLMNGSKIMYHSVWRNVTSYTISFENKTVSQTPIVTDADCDTTKTCFKDPENCDVGTSGCRFYSWTKQAEADGSYEFEMSGGTGDGQQYIAMALGTISAMQDADLYYCDGTAVRSGVIQALHNPPAYLEMTGGLATKKAATANGVAQCVFSRPASVTKPISNGESKNFDITKEGFYLLGAIGPMNGNQISKHNVWRTLSSSTYQFGVVETPVTDAGCDTTKTCFKQPENCVVGSAGCRFYSWRKNENATYDFEMSGSSNGEYVAFALGTTNAMQDADLYYCDGQAIRSGAIQKLHNPPAYLTMTNGLSTKSATMINGVSHCVLNRPASVTKMISNGASKNFDLTAENYYLLAAVGQMQVNGDQIQKHTWRTLTDSRVVAFSSATRVTILQPTLLGFFALVIIRSSAYLADK